MTMEALLQRLEEADGPDRELDCAIVKALFGVNPYPTAFPARDWEFYTDERPITLVPSYTASIDAALTLVPEGFKWKLGYSRHVPCNADVVDYRNPRDHPMQGRFDGECDSNHAIALCIAALKARAALKSPDHQSNASPPSKAIVQS